LCSKDFLVRLQLAGIGLRFRGAMLPPYWRGFVIYDNGLAIGQYKQKVKRSVPLAASDARSRNRHFRDTGCAGVFCDDPIPKERAGNNFPVS
jgi:hypothetical protein